MIESTPSGVRILAVPHNPDEDAVNITEWVMALYDLVIGSMDWGGIGFLTVEDALPVVHVAKTCGFPEYKEAEAYVRRQAHSEEQQQFLNELSKTRTEYRWKNYRDIPHDHILSSVGRCMWPGCPEGLGTPSDPE